MWYNKKMDNLSEIEKIPSVHKILAHSYATYFIFFLAGVCLDLIFKFKVFTSSMLQVWGFVLIALGTLLIFWAQRTSRNLKKDTITKETFRGGPYSYTRSPTHWGLFLLMLGFGLVTNAFFVMIFSIVAFVFTKITFLHKEEEILALKYGAPYMEYKRSVKL
jgi:protein-S-isoprenylcysteine O-methyltransferase Ste14